MDQFDDLFPATVTAKYQPIVEQTLAPVVATESKSGWFLWLLVLAATVVLGFLGYMFMHNKKSVNLDAHSIPAEPLATWASAQTLPQLAELQETVTLEPKSLAPLIAPAPIVAPVAPIVKAISKAVAEEKPLEGAELAKHVGTNIKSALLKHNVKPETVTSIVTHAIKTLLQQDSKPSVQQQVAQQQPLRVPQFDPNGGVFSLRGKQLPIPKVLEDEAQDEPIKAGTKEGKINAETNPKLLEYMKSRGLTVQ